MRVLLICVRGLDKLDARTFDLDRFLLEEEASREPDRFQAEVRAASEGEDEIWRQITLVVVVVVVH